jgi:Beta-propeller repeat
VLFTGKSGGRQGEMLSQSRFGRLFGQTLVAIPTVTVLLLFGSGHLSRETPLGKPTALAKRQAVGAYARLPLAFTANAGQTDSRVRYYARGAGFSIFLTRREAVIALRRPGKGRRTARAMLALGFLGANRNVVLGTERPQKGRVNYLIGNDPSKWHTGLETYARVAYRNLWPGIDLVVHGLHGRVKYEFLVRPGARVGEIRLAYRGAKSLSLDRHGNLRLRTSAGTVTDTRPVSYQSIGGRHVRVPSNFALTPRGSAYGFGLPSGYDHRYPLVIDPGLVYSTYLGGRGFDTDPDIALDADGNAYITGQTDSTDFPTSPGAFQRSYAGGQYDAVVTKLSASGGGLVYSTYLGGNSDDHGGAIALDGAGDAYLTGDTGSPDFPTTPGAFDRTLNGGDDVFVAKLDASGAALDHSTYLGGADYDVGGDIAVDASGRAFVTGVTGSSDFPTTPGAFDTTFNVFGPTVNDGVSVGTDAFVARVDAGGTLGYSTFLGLAYGLGIAVDAHDRAYVTGGAWSMPTTRGAFDRTCDFFLGDAFMTRLNASGSSLVYSTCLGGSNQDTGRGIALDRVGNAYVTGSTYSTDFPTTPGAFQTSPTGSFGDAFVTKLNARGAALRYSTYLGGDNDGQEMGTGIALDGASHAYVIGFTSAPDFPTTPDAFDRTWNGLTDAFVTKLNAGGSALDYSTYLGGSAFEFGWRIAVDRAGNPYVTGTTDGSDFPTTPGAFDRTWNLADDLFVTKLDTAGRHLNRGAKTNRVVGKGPRR